MREQGQRLGLRMGVLMTRVGVREDPEVVQKWKRVACPDCFPLKFWAGSSAVRSIHDNVRDYCDSFKQTPTVVVMNSVMTS